MFLWIVLVLSSLPVTFIIHYYFLLLSSSGFFLSSSSSAASLYVIYVYIYNYT